MKLTGTFFKVAILSLSVILFIETLTITNTRFASVRAHADTVNTPTPTTAVEKSLTFIGSTKASGVFSGAGLSVALPENIQTGDLLIAVAGTNGPKSAWSVPTGWTLGVNSDSTDTQGITWWWKMANGNEAGTQVVFRSSKYADGGAVVNVYHGQAVSPIAGVSAFTTSDNFGNGFVTSANISGVTLGSEEAAVPLIFASWQESNAAIGWPSGFAFESTASDGFSTIAVAEKLTSLTTTTFPGYTLPISPAQAVVQTLQVLIRVQ